MSDWNDIHFERDGLPRGYVLAARDQYEPVAPWLWMRFDGDVGVQGAIELADRHRGIAGTRDPMDVRVLAERFSAIKATCVAVSPQCSVLLTPSFYDACACPVAIAANSRDQDVRPSAARPFASL